MGAAFLFCSAFPNHYRQHKQHKINRLQQRHNGNTPGSFRRFFLVMLPNSSAHQKHLVQDFYKISIAVIGMFQR
jgi:hypothetical protein